MRATAALLAALILVAACGTKGALFIPPPGGDPKADRRTR
jgi:predicted small lipoprotein YifL